MTTFGLGPWTAWHENGQKSDEGTFKDGEKEGTWATWHANGQKWSEGTTKDGKRDGKKITEATFKNGELIKEETFD